MNQVSKPAPPQKHEAIRPTRTPRWKKICLLLGGLAFCAAATALDFGRIASEQAQAAESELRADTSRSIRQILNSKPQTVSECARQANLLSGLRPPEQIPLSALRGNPFGRASSLPTAPDSDADRLAALAEVKNLRLQSILCGDQQRSCTINGGAYAEGRTLDNFVIEKINPSSVVVRTGLYRFELCVQN